MNVLVTAAWVDFEARIEGRSVGKIMRDVRRMEVAGIIVKFGWVEEGGRRWWSAWFELCCVSW